MFGESLILLRFSQPWNALFPIFSIVSGILNVCAFMQAPKLKRVILPANLSKIEAQLFDKCPCLHDIEIPKIVYYYP